MTILEQNLGRKAIPASPAPWRRRSRLQRATAVVLPLLRRPGFSLALLVVVFSLVAAVAPHLLSSFDPYAHVPPRQARAPNLSHWFGTDELGRDLYTRVVYGASLSVLAAF
ncbi:ABC transporter permease, partial [Pseudomonas sp. MAFF 311095]|nr:ABC transporter permease [Pseudomonas petroselini]